MLKEFAQYLQSLKDNQLYEINGDTYSDNRLVRVAPHVDRPESITVSGLDSVVKLIRNEMDMFENLPIFVQVKGPGKVEVFTTYDDTMTRDAMYEATCDAPEFRGGFQEYEEAIIALRSKFAPTEEVAYLLDLLSRINRDNGVTTEDNGVSQVVEARQGVSLKAMVNVKPRIRLRPYRTFLEVEQPESEFLLRLDGEGNVGLFEADGGMWKLEAKRNIAGYFEEALKAEIGGGKVVVMV